MLKPCFSTVVKKLVHRFPPCQPLCIPLISDVLTVLECSYVNIGGISDHMLFDGGL